MSVTNCDQSETMESLLETEPARERKDVGETKQENKMYSQERTMTTGNLFPWTKNPSKLVLYPWQL